MLLKRLVSLLLSRRFYAFADLSDERACILFGVQEDERKKEEKDERKRKYNVKYTNDVMIVTLSLTLYLASNHCIDLTEIN